MTIPVIPSKEVASNIDADGLNELWNKLTEQFDAYYNSIEPKSNQGIINKAISDWQDFYYGQQGIWPADEVVRWRTIYQKTAETLNISIKLGAKPEALPVATTQAKKSTADAVFYVTGKTEPAVIRDIMIPKFASPINLTSPTWLGALLLGIPLGAYLLKRMKGRKRG